MSAYQEIKSSLRQLYLGDPRPWLVGYSGGKDNRITRRQSAIGNPQSEIPHRPIEYLSTEEVWAGRNGERAATAWTLDSFSASTPSCGNSRFGCWTCTVVERDKASELRARVKKATFQHTPFVCRPIWN